uniref:CCHC-type domain-containing protein n=1 Tax=Ananas comosus var. bracteatus TaxID=296719 RepID=A0A6V7PX76_ANACO|nr:unnamed protein product [Ananas comosus var. bracteatus]
MREKGKEKVAPPPASYARSCLIGKEKVVLPAPSCSKGKEKVEACSGVLKSTEEATSAWFFRVPRASVALPCGSSEGEACQHLWSRASTPPPFSSPHPRHQLPDRFSFKGRCYRCLGRSHHASQCRDPIRCVRCYKSGHLARSCMNRLPRELYRAMRARPSYLSAFVPLFDDFAGRQNRRRNAILADVVSPANLGHFPQDTIANGLANRFGGSPSDFHVATYREREFVIFLPEWVPCDQLLRREILSLGALRLRCFR